MSLIDLDSPEIQEVFSKFSAKERKKTEDEMRKYCLEDTYGFSGGYTAVQRMQYEYYRVLAALVNTYSDISWKSRKYNDGVPLSAEDAFLVGINTPKGNYVNTVYCDLWDIFKCKELKRAPKFASYGCNADEQLASLLPIYDEYFDRCWAAQEVDHAIKKFDETEDDKDERDYWHKIYESALKAYKSIWRDSVFKWSISDRQKILNRLLDRHLLTAIEDEPGEWYDITRDPEKQHEYQAKRLDSFFKTVDSDGKVSYYDIARIDRPHFTYKELASHRYRSKSVAYVIYRINELYPIKMPYMPSDEKFNIILMNEERFPVDDINNSPNYDVKSTYLVVVPGGSDDVEIVAYCKVENGSTELIFEKEFNERRDEYDSWVKNKRRNNDDKH